MYVCEKAKEGLAGYWKEVQQEVIQLDDGQNERNMKSEHSGGICAGVSCLFKHLLPPFTFGATNREGGISINFQQENFDMLYSNVTTG